ncbi:hypothetical protein CEN39_04255 [Fischerella thermalis CCMEE 5201]|jgi:hypothetical protein|nr:hypothetical protein CEN39_04255 [Fischerella thermalis CCMEE 5201]
MSNLFPQNQGSSKNELNSHNSLSQYIQSMSPEVLTHLSKPVSRDALQLIMQAVTRKLNSLTTEQFNGLIATNRETLGMLLGEAMVDGYFLRNAEQRMEMERLLPSLDTNSSNVE